MLKNVWFISSGYFDTIKLQNLICWEDIGCRFVSYSHKIVEFGKKESKKPDILILNYGLTSAEIRHYMHLVNQEKLNIQVILFTVQPMNTPPNITESGVTTISWDGLTPTQLKEVVEDVIATSNKEGTSVTYHQKNRSTFNENQQLKELVGKAEIFSFAKLLIDVPNVDKNYSYLLSTKVKKLLGGLLAGKLFVEKNTLILCVDCSNASPFEKNDSKLYVCMQQILWYANKIQPGNAALLISKPAVPADIQLAYRELLDLEHYHYFCKEVPLLTMNYINIYQKDVKENDQGALVSKLLRSILNGDGVEVVGILDAIYLYRIKPSMNIKLLQFYRKEIENCLVTIARFKEIPLDYFKIDSVYSVLEDELYETCRICRDITEVTTKNTKEFPALIAHTLTIVASEYSYPISLNEVAQMQRVSKSYLGRIFKQTMGMVLVDYLQQVRIDAAKELMACGHRRIAEIATKAGFFDPAYFSRVFKKKEGVSPTEYFNNL